MQHLPVTKYLKLPFLFEEQSLLDDLNNISEESWLPQIYEMNYQGKWTSLALLEQAGDEGNAFSHANPSEHLQESLILRQCPYFRYVLDQFKCPLTTARLLRLEAGAIIKPHKDFKLGYEDDNFRIHVPILTHDQVEFVLGGEKISMLPGECWYTNVNFTHSVANNGTQDRIHLVIDGERNDWSDELFFSLAPKESFGLKERGADMENQLKIIQELERSELPIAKELIKDLKKKMDKQEI